MIAPLATHQNAQEIIQSLALPKSHSPPLDTVFDYTVADWIAGIEILGAVNLYNRYSRRSVEALPLRVVDVGVSAVFGE